MHDGMGPQVGVVTETLPQRHKNGESLGTAPCGSLIRVLGQIGLMTV
jgi:hypothetical protein